MYILNYIYFIILTGLGVKFLLQKQKLANNPLNHNQKLLLDGPESFWILTFSTGLLALSAPGGIDLMAIRLLVLELFCLFGIFVVKRKPVWSLCALFYLLYIIWIIIGLSYSPSKPYGFRVFLKYLYPFLFMLFASAVVRHKEVFVKAGLGARVVAIISVIIAFTPYLEYLFPGVIWYGTARAINYISISIFSLALFYYAGRNRHNLYLAILFMIPCIIWIFRTSIMGMALALATFFFFRYKLKSLPVILTVLIVFIGTIFLIPDVKNKMFREGTNKNISELHNGEISIDDINSNGRFAMWNVLMNKFYDKKELTGSGTGSVQNYLYTNHVFGGLKASHGDYVQILCDSGLIGLILYLLSAFVAIIHSFIEYSKKQTSLYVKTCAITAGASMMGVLLTMYTDNVVNYSMATLSLPFGFYGMMLGLIRGDKLKK